MGFKGSCGVDPTPPPVPPHRGQYEGEEDEKELVVRMGIAAKARRSNPQKARVPETKEGEEELVVGELGKEEGDFSKLNSSGATSTDDSAVFFEEDGDYENCEEEIQAISDYGKTGAAVVTVSQGEGVETPQQLAVETGGLKNFLVQIWNWLGYLFVTILWLNLTSCFAEKEECLVQEMEDDLACSKREQGQDILEENSGSVSYDQVDGDDGAISDENPSEETDALSGNSSNSVITTTDASSEGSGNLGDIDGELCDKSSEDGGRASSPVPSAIGEEALPTQEEIAARVIAQVELIFSNENLAKDGFLLKHVRRRTDGYVSLKLVAGLRRVKHIAKQFSQVLDALRHSAKMEVNPEGTKVRRREPLTSSLLNIQIKCKEREGKKGGKEAPSNDENQLPPQSSSTTSSNRPSYRVSSHSAGKGTPDKENGSGGGSGGNNQRRRSGLVASSSRPNSYSEGSSTNPRHRNSNASKTTGSTPPPARGSYPSAYSSSGEESSAPFVTRRHHQTTVVPSGVSKPRPKSAGYCEDSVTMNPWLQRRKASAASFRQSSGELIFSGVIRQPRGPDGTPGFHPGYRNILAKENRQRKHYSAVSM